MAPIFMSISWLQFWSLSLADAARSVLFCYFARGPGTIVNDFIYGAYLEELQRFERHIAEAVRNQQFLRTPKR